MPRLMRAFTLDQAVSDAVNDIVAEGRLGPRILLLLGDIPPPAVGPDEVDGNGLTIVDYAKFFSMLGVPEALGLDPEPLKSSASWPEKFAAYQMAKPPWARLQAALLSAYGTRPEIAHRVELAIREAKKLNRREARKWETRLGRPPTKRAGLANASRVVDALLGLGLEALAVKMEKKAPERKAGRTAEKTEPKKKADMAHEPATCKTGHAGQGKAQWTGTRGNKEAQI